MPIPVTSLQYRWRDSNAHARRFELPRYTGSHHIGSLTLGRYARTFCLLPQTLATTSLDLWGHDDRTGVTRRDTC